MRRLLIITGLLLSLIALAAVASFAEKPKMQEKDICMVMSGNPAEIAIYGLIRSIHGLGGDIKVEGDKVSLTLNLDSKQIKMLKEALAKPEPMMGQMMVTTRVRTDFDEDYTSTTRSNLSEKSGRFLHGNMGGEGCGMMGEGGCKMMGKDGKCGCCGDDCKMKQGGKCDGKCECCKDGCKMMGEGCGMMKGMQGGCKMMQGMMGKEGKGCGMMGGMMQGMPGMEGMKGMHGMMGGMMGMMPPMDMEITGKCPKCGEMMNFTVKCKMKMPPMGDMGMIGMMPPPPPDAPKPEGCKDCENK